MTSQASLLLPHSWVTCSLGSWLPCCEVTQAAAWKKSTWEELRPRANSQGSEPPWRLIFQPQLSLPMRPWPQSIAGL